MLVYKSASWLHEVQPKSVSLIVATERVPIGRNLGFLNTVCGN